MPSCIVTFNQDGAQSDISGRRLEANRHVVQKSPDDLLLIHANHAFIRPRHSNVSDVGRAFGQDTLISSWNVGMSSEDSRDSAIEIPAKRDFLGGGFSVNVHENHFGLELIEQAVDGAEWVV